MSSIQIYFYDSGDSVASQRGLLSEYPVERLFLEEGHGVEFLLFATTLLHKQ